MKKYSAEEVVELFNEFCMWNRINTDERKSDFLKDKGLIEDIDVVSYFDNKWAEIIEEEKEGCQVYKELKNPDNPTGFRMCFSCLRKIQQKNIVKEIYEDGGFVIDIKSKSGVEIANKIKEYIAYPVEIKFNGETYIKK